MSFKNAQLAKFICAIFFLNGSFLLAQDGPAGFEDTTGTSSLILWLDASKIEGIADLNTISSWEDASGYAHHASNSNTSIKPHYRENIVNGNAVVGFNGSSDYLQGSFTGNFAAPSTVIVVPYFNDIDQSNDDNGYVISIGTGGASNAHTSIARRKSSGGNGNQYYAWVNDGSPKLGDTIIGETWNIISQLNASSVPYHNMYLNGAVSSSLTDYSAAVNTDGVFRVGGWYNGGATNFLDGRIAEVLAYNKVLNSMELKLVHAYLSAKYNIAISNDVYNGDDGGNGDNDLDVAGLAVESGDTNSSANSAGIRMSINQNFEDGDYVVFGHNVVNNSVNNTDVNGSIVERWNRAWWFDITNSGSNVSVNITFSQEDAQLGFGGLGSSNSADYKLIYRSGTSGNWTVLATADGVTANEIIFSNVTVTADGYYTLASIDANSQVGNSPVNSSDQGPGGVGEIDGSSNLYIWYNAGDMEGATGDEILSVADESGYGNDVTQTGFLNIPEFQASQVNGRSAISFNGANHYLEGSLTTTLTPPLTVFTVAYFDNLNQGNDDNDYVYSVGTGLNRGDQISLSRRKANDEDDVANINKYYSWDGDTARFGDAITGQQWTVFTQRFQPADSSVMHSAQFNNADASATDNEISFTTGNNTMAIGRWNGVNHWLDGSFAELIMYNRLLNSAEENIVEAYLSGKYNISISNDRYNGDDGGNGDNDLNIAGVGTEADGSNDTASSKGIIVSRVSGFSNGDYVIFGHAQEAVGVNTADATDDLGAVTARWNRAWYFDVTNTGGDPVVNISFDFSDYGTDGFPGSEGNVNYALLYRSGSSGTWTNLSSSGTNTGDQVHFNNISITADGFFTLGTSNLVNSPLPVSLTAFKAKQEANGVRLFWETATEINNDYFLLERSTNSYDFAPIQRIQGAGNSSTFQQYAFLDKDIPLGQTIYYRLIQTDFNGAQKTYGPVVVGNAIAAVKIYPNPVDGILKLESLDKDFFRIVILNMEGREMLSYLPSEEENISIDVSRLKEGIYQLRMEHRAGIVSKQILVVH